MTPQIGTNRVTTRTLLLLFIALLALASGAFNLRDRLNQKVVLTDGVVWRDDAELGVVADRIEPGSAAAKESIRRGYVLIGISPTGSSDDFEVVEKAQHVQIYLDLAKDRAGDRNPATLSYWIEKRNDTGDTAMGEGVADLKLAARPTNNLRGLYLAMVGLIYLAIGIYFLLRQGRAPYVTHFFLLCLLAFVAHFYSPTEEMRMQFDKAIDFADTLALILLAPMFLHFAAIYPARAQLFSRRRWLVVALYLPSVVMILAEIWLRFSALRNLLPISPLNARNWLSKIELLFFAASLIASAAMLVRTFRKAPNIVVRQQLKWVMWGMSVASALFAAFYLPSFFADLTVSGSLELISLLPMALIPLTLGYSIARFRLTDVDVVMRRSFAYIIATLSVAALFGTVMAVSYESLRLQLSQEASLLIAAIAMSVLAMLFAPVKNWLQERIDRIFYGEKYDYRVTLQDFGRTLASTTELDPLLDSLMRRLREVFSVERLAIFVEDLTEPSGFRVARSEGIDRAISLPSEFLNILRDRTDSSGIVRVESTDAEEEAVTGRLITPDESLSRRMFSYFVPCGSRSRIVAVLALGRSTDGALLSSEDTDLLRAISGYVAVAIENALLLEEQATRAKELARLKEFNENIVESINVGVMVISFSGRITNWNGALEEIYGLRRGETIGRRITEVFDTEMLRTLRELMARSQWKNGHHNGANGNGNGNGSYSTNAFANGSAGEPVNIYKFRARSADDRDLTLNISLAPLQSKTSQIEGTLVAIENVTERIRLEEQLQQSDKLSSIGLLAAGVAHEVNTPLTGISSYSQMLMQQIPETDPRHQLLEKIHRQTSRASSIVNNLLNFSRVSDARLVPVALNQVLDDTIQLLEAQLRNTEIEVVRNYDPILPFTPGNAAKLQQVFMNLILNARDAMPQGGRLEIATESNLDSIFISFRDTGVGIAADHLAKIYDPFFTTKQIGKGTGLGLAVSYGIIRDHGGLIAVESQPGEGTVFQISLPLVTAHQQLAAASD
ncbi:MAG: ATP-binding protein [Acidobacteriota bacterium]|nr:ATP-binding protein [Acidobacteriota bacterium]